MNGLFWFLLIFSFLLLLIFYKPLREFIGRYLKIFSGLIGKYFPQVKESLTKNLKKVGKIIGAYGLVVTVTVAIVIVLMILALLINQPIFTAIVFLLSIVTLLLVWMPVGLMLRIFGAKTVVPRPLKTFVVSLAFFGFLLLFWPTLLSFKLLLGLSFLGFITFGLTAKFNVIDKIILPLVVIMLIILAWQHFFPEDFNSTVRYAQSWSKKINAGKRRASLKNETVASTTYALLLKDVSTLYVQNGSQLDVISKELKQGLMVRVVSDKDTVLIYDGMGFMQIQLPNDSGSFVGGGKYLIEAPFIQVTSPREMIPEIDLSEKRKSSNDEEQKEMNGYVLLSPGKLHHWLLRPGEETPWLSMPKTRKFSYTIDSNIRKYEVIFADGSRYPSGSSIPHKDYTLFKVKADTVQTVFVEIF